MPLRILFAFILLFSLFACTQDPKPPLAENGYLDLSGWNFNQNGNAHLDGQWSVYQQQLLTPAELSGPHPPKPAGTLIIPGLWSSRSAVGYATFRLRVRLNAELPALALRMGDVISAYRLWINGKPVAAVGTVGTSRQDEISKTGERIIRIEPGVQNMDLVLHTSNFHDSTGGIADTIRFGLEADILEQARKGLGYSLIIIGCLLVMGIYHVLLYMIRPSDRPTLYFGLMCLQMAIWYLASCSSDRFIRCLLPTLSQQALYRIDLLSFYLFLPTALMYVHHSFPRESIRLALRLFQIPAVICCLVVLVTPSYIFAHTIVPYEILCLLAIAYSFGVLSKAVFRRREGSAWMLAGFAVFALTAVNDILYSIRLLQTGYIVPLGVLTLVICNSFVLALRFFKAFSTVEILSRDLEDKNIALSRLDRIKDEFLANTSHELRTPLNGIIGLAESIRDGALGSLPDPIKKNLGMITSSGRRLLGLINDLLDFSRLKNRDIHLNKKPVDIRALTDTVLGVSKPLIAHKDLVMKNQIPEDIPYVYGDELRLQQILYNLVGNAIKFTDAGEVKVTADQKDTLVEICVTDTGIGIAEAHFDTIFKSFEQLEGSETRQFEGTGLGLAIAKNMVELHGGTIGVSSTQNTGTSFFFTLPVSHDPPGPEPEHLIAKPLPWVVKEPPLPAMPDRDMEGDPGTGQRVLVVDDDPVNLEVVKNQLSFLDGIRVYTRMNGPEALGWIIENGCPDLVLLDIMMPGMTGYEVCSALRRDYTASELPVIILTAKNRVSDLTEGFACGANDYLTKPVAREELLGRVRTQLELKGAYITFIDNERLEREVEQQTRKKEMARLREEKEKLEKLRYQLNPHFLFNALASIRGAVLKDRDAAHKMISHLAEFSRLALSRGSMDTLTVKREFEISQHYLTMEQMRFGDYLNISIEIDPDAESCQVPAFMIQPLVENAVKYGSRTCPDALEIRIAVKTQPPDTLVLEISNTGTWVIPGDTDKKLSTGTGIDNVRQRLEKYYGDEYSFEKHTEDGRVTFEIIVPQVMP